MRRELTNNRGGRIRCCGAHSLSNDKAFHDRKDNRIKPSLIEPVIDQVSSPACLCSSQRYEAAPFADRLSECRDLIVVLMLVKHEIESQEHEGEADKASRASEGNVARGK